MNLIGLIRARNEDRWIGRVVASMLQCCSTVLLMDDHSTDETAARAVSAGAIVVPSPFDSFHETRDKNWLHARGLDFKPDWVLMVDGDEMLAPGAARLITAAIEREQPDAYRLPIRYLWDREDQIRTDRLYGTFTRPSLYRVMTGQKFSSQYLHGAALRNTPAGMSCELLPADVLHFGYQYREDRLRKLKYYNDLDPNNEFEDRYRHMCIGDLPDLPASAVTKWAGPLTLETIPT